MNCYSDVMVVAMLTVHGLLAGNTEFYCGMSRDHKLGNECVHGSMKDSSTKS